MTFILGPEMIGNLNIKTKMFDFEECVLIGWLANIVREPANQDAYLKVQHFCFYVMVVYHFRPEYSQDYANIQSIAYENFNIFPKKY